MLCCLFYQGASAYAIVVIAVYGFSIVLLIGSHIFLKKKEDKADGQTDKQIDIYLQQVTFPLSCLMLD